jgi:hypothetical protein
VLGLVFYNHGAPNGAFPTPNSTENSAKSTTHTQRPGNECFAPGITGHGRFPPSASLLLSQEAAAMTCRGKKEDQQNHGRTESYSPAFNGPASNGSGFAPHDSVRS